MAQQTINIGSVANDGTGDPLRTALGKVNANFTEFYTAIVPVGTNVGIGTSAPGNALTISRAGGTAAYLSAFSGTNQALYGVGGGGELVTGSFSSQPYLFYTNSIERMRITSAGNVGIGTSAPGALLNVVANTSTDAVRITQTGAGNALVVEDSANPDSTPFVIDNAGVVGIGEVSPSSYASSGLVLKSATAFTPSIFNWNTTNDNNQPSFGFRKDRAGATVNNGDSLGLLRWQAYDGASYRTAASIEAAVDGTPGVNDMPGRLVFSTTADGAASPTERMRITSAGSVGIGTNAAAASAALDVTSTTAGVLFPRMTTAQRDAISTPVDGLVVFNTTDVKLQVRAGGIWVNLH